MTDPLPLTAQDYDVWLLASPTHLLALLKKLGVEGRATAAWLGVTPACVSQWSTGKRPIHPRYVPALRLWAQDALTQQEQRTNKDAEAQPTEALQAAVKAEFTAIWNHWKQQVLFDAGTLLKQLHQQYYALGGWILQERYRPEDLASVKLVMEAMVQQMQRLILLQGDVPSPEDELIARLTAAHEAAQTQEDSDE
jgi:DNA-binding transcriptional regulator YdaS (Cro superfamily)